MVKAVVLGAASEFPDLCSFYSLFPIDALSGEIGQPLALLLKANPLVTQVIG